MYLDVIRAFAMASAWLLSAPANAVVLTASGEISAGTEVDHWNITLESPTSLTVDVLAYEIGPLGAVDFFGNGVGNDVLDSSIYLFADSTAGALIAFNDGNGGLGSDGSVSTLDAFISPGFLPAGTYVLAIGDFLLLQSDARDGFNDFNADDTSVGKYQLTFAADTDITVSAVPVPATLWLFGSGLLGMIGIARRRKFA